MPKTAEEWCKQGQELNQISKTQESLECFNKALEQKPNYTEALLGKSSALELLGKYDEALTHVNRTIELDPKNALAYSIKGILVHHTGGKPEEALQFLDKAIALNPKNPKVYDNKASVLLQLGRYEEALETCDKCIALNKKYDHIYDVKLHIYNVKNNVDKVVECSDKAMTLFPCAFYACEKGKALEKSGKKQEAIETYMYACKLMEEGKPGAGLTPEMLDFIKNTLKPFQELDKIVEDAELHIEMFKRNSSQRQKFTVHIVELKKKKSSMTENILANFDMKKLTDEEREQVESLKVEFSDQIREMQEELEKLQKELAQSKNKVVKIKDDMKETKQEVALKKDRHSSQTNENMEHLNSPSAQNGNVEVVPKRSSACCNMF